MPASDRSPPTSAALTRRISSAPASIRAAAFKSAAFFIAVGAARNASAAGRAAAAIRAIMSSSVSVIAMPIEYEVVLFNHGRTPPIAENAFDLIGFLPRDGGDFNRAERRKSLRDNIARLRAYADGVAALEIAADADDSSR